MEPEQYIQSGLGSTGPLDDLGSVCSTPGCASSELA